MLTARLTAQPPVLDLLQCLRVCRQAGMQPCRWAGGHLFEGRCLLCLRQPLDQVQHLSVCSQDVIPVRLLHMRACRIPDMMSGPKALLAD